MTRYLALDVGDRRIGLAVADDTFGIARPLSTIRRHDVEADVRAVGKVVAEEEATALVIGLPLTLRGEEGLQAQRVRRFADACAPLGLPVELYDERHTTTEAIRLGAPDVDAAAAALLLEDYLSSLRRRTRREP